MFMQEKENAKVKEITKEFLSKKLKEDLASGRLLVILGCHQQRCNTISKNINLKQDNNN